jgi:hypothetical protein
MENQNSALALRDTPQGIQVYQEESALSPRQLLEQVELIQSVMKSVMKEGEHYGTIPGCGEKKSLFKPGAEKLSLTFRLRPDYEETIIDLPNGHREYRIKCNLFSIVTGRPIGQGLGSCCTLEAKYRFRPGPAELTGKPVPKSYWDIRKSDPKKAQELIGGRGFVTKKNDSGVWEIATQGEKVEHDNPADYYNTCLKIGKKRAHVDAILTATGASDIFTQDIEDIAENLSAYNGNTPPPEDHAPKPNPGNTETHVKETFIEHSQAAANVIDDWRGVEIHFGKNKGVKLGQMNASSLKWYQEDWEPSEWPEGSGKYKEVDLKLRRALNESMEAK